jgi:hypothetical protein
MDDREYTYLTDSVTKDQITAILRDYALATARLDPLSASSERRKLFDLIDYALGQQYEEGYNDAKEGFS